MTVQVASNGFGRIGGQVHRVLVGSGRADNASVLINDLGSVDANLHPFCYGSVRGRLSVEMHVEGDSIAIRRNGRRYGPIRVRAERGPAQLQLSGLDAAMECTGLIWVEPRAHRRRGSTFHC